MGVLDGKVAIVTGAARGLGVGEALALAKEGAAVTVVDIDHDGVVRTAARIEAAGGRALALRCDVSDRVQVEKAVKETVDKFGSIDILVNNAQAIPARHPFEEWTEEEMRVTWESGPLGSWFFMVACFPYMKKKGGSIINFTSPSAHGAITGYVGYSIAKEAIRALSRNGAREWGKYRITVNTISPSAMSDWVRTHLDTDEKLQAVFDELGTAIRELSDPEADIGRGVVFLAGPDARHITGCTLSIDSGSAML